MLSKYKKCIICNLDKNLSKFIDNINYCDKCLSKGDNCEECNYYFTNNVFNKYDGKHCHNCCTKKNICMHCGYIYSNLNNYSTKKGIFYLCDTCYNGNDNCIICNKSYTIKTLKKYGNICKYCNSSKIKCNLCFRDYSFKKIGLGIDGIHCNNCYDNYVKKYDCDSYLGYCNDFPDYSDFLHLINIGLKKLNVNHTPILTLISEYLMCENYGKCTNKSVKKNKCCLCNDERAFDLASPLYDYDSRSIEYCEYCKKSM